MVLAQHQLELKQSMGGEQDHINRRAQQAESIQIALAQHPELAQCIEKQQTGFYVTAKNGEYNVQPFLREPIPGRKSTFLRRSSKANNTSTVCDAFEPQIVSPVSRDVTYGSETEEDDFDLQSPKKRTTTYTRRRRAQFVTQNSFSTDPELSSESKCSEAETDLLILRGQTSKSFRIDDTAKVLEFLGSRLRRMQQLATKKVAKTWIKGICPKKQARFPYLTHRRAKSIENRKEPQVPPWWPRKEDCIFKEPDHIDRRQRTQLCIHLLRLRPTPEQLSAWNGGNGECHRVHVREGWTRFLQTLTGHELFEDLSKQDNRLRKKQRQDLLDQMYQVAHTEELYVSGEIDGSTLFWCSEDDEDRSSMANKRSRRDSGASEAKAGPQESHSATGRVPGKKVRRVLTVDQSSETPAQIEIQDGLCCVSAQARTQEESDTGCNELRTERENIGSDLENNDARDAKMSKANNGFSYTGPGDFKFVPMKRESSSRSHNSDQIQQWATTVRGWADHTSSSFDSNRTSHVELDCNQGFMLPANLPETQYFDLPQCHQHPNTVRVHQINDVPNPQFHSVPTTPTSYPPNSMMPVPLADFVLSNYQLPQASFTTPLLPYEYFPPAAEDCFLADFQAVVHPPMALPHEMSQQSRQQGLAQRHLTPTQAQAFHAPPFNTCSGWTGEGYPGNNPI